MRTAFVSELKEDGGELNRRGIKRACAREWDRGREGENGRREKVRVFGVITRATSFLSCRRRRDRRGSGDLGQIPSEASSGLSVVDATAAGGPLQ